MDEQANNGFYNYKQKVQNNACYKSGVHRSKCYNMTMGMAGMAMGMVRVAMCVRFLHKAAKVTFNEYASCGYFKPAGNA
jgi:hypothetical protein